MYVDGVGVEKDYLKAKEWYKKALDNGYIQAKKNLELLEKL